MIGLQKAVESSAGGNGGEHISTSGSSMSEGGGNGSSWVSSMVIGLSLVLPGVEATVPSGLCKISTALMNVFWMA